MVAQRQRDKRRAHAIRSAFLEVLEERGFEGTTLMEVSRRAGVAGGLVHYHFRDKPGLLHRALRERSAQRRAQLRALLQLPLPPRTRVLALVEAFLALSSERSNLAIWSAALAAGPREHTIRYESWCLLQKDLEVFEEALRELPAQERVERVESGLLLLLSGALALMTLSPDPMTITALGAEVQRVAGVLLDGAAHPREGPVERVGLAKSATGQLLPV